MFTYTVFKIEADGETRSNKEHLDNLDEVNTWLVQRLFNNVLVIQDQTGKEKRLYRTEDNRYIKC